MGTLSKILDRKITGFVCSLSLLLGVVFNIITLSSSTILTDKSVWSTASFAIGGDNFIPTACMVLILLFVVNVAMTLVGVVNSLFGKKFKMWPLAVMFCTQLLFYVIDAVFLILYSNALPIVALIFASLGLIFGVVVGFFDSDKKSSKLKNSDYKLKKLLLVLSCISVFAIFILLFVPLFSYVSGGVTFSVVPICFTSSGEDNVLCLAVFALIFVLSAIAVKMLFACFANYNSEDLVFVKKAKSLSVFSAAVTGGYFFMGVTTCSLNTVPENEYSTISYIPLLFSITVLIVCAVITSKFVSTVEPDTEKTANAARIEMFIYSSVAAIITIIAAFSDILKVTVSKPSIMDDIFLNGYEVLQNYNNFDSGFQLVAFVILIIFAVCSALLVASLVALISKSKLFFKITLAQLISSAAFSLLIGMFGKYYEIVQRINEEKIMGLVNTILGKNYSSIEYVVESQALYWAIGVMAICLVALIRKPYSRGVVGETPVLAANTYYGKSQSAASGFDSSNEVSEPTSTEFDPCPAFTELDKKAVMLREQEEEKKQLEFQSPTLPELVQFIVNYARDSRLHLSYTPEDIATFIAGLGATRLSILQGMSGTGKTSLPKIFAEAVLGNCEIVEVESSWRDKNELLGYYNEFSKTYTPKKFTQALYKAKFNPETITFIVLDEMNLSRIEYYFSDFLSLMENEEENRYIKLLNVGLRRAENGSYRTYSQLTEGHTLKVPNNIWFIGTANRDESTFEISDKVYDRAHTMNFNKRAAKPLTYGAPIPQRFVSVDIFIEMINKAKSSVRFNIDNYPIIKEVEALLEPYNISFGNRIANQIESFVSVYCSCFASPDAVLGDAVERILLSKVVSKLEFKNVENKTQLAAKFEKLGLHRCSEFILKLNED